MLLFIFRSILLIEIHSFAYNIRKDSSAFPFESMINNVNSFNIEGRHVNVM